MWSAGAPDVLSYPGEYSAVFRGRFRVALSFFQWCGRYDGSRSYSSRNR